MRINLGIWVACVVAITGCFHRGASEPTPSPGMIAGLIRDAASGEAIQNAIIVVRRPGEIAPTREESDVNGAYMIAELPAGSYAVTAYVAKTIIGERNAEVRPGETLGLDFTVGHVEGDVPDLNAPGAPALWRFRPRDAEPTLGRIEGTVADIHFARLVSAVVTVVSAGQMRTEQTITDEHGRFTVDELPPGTYEVSAYYSVAGRGAIEVRRSRVLVAGGEVVVVPLWLDTENR